MKLCGEGWVLGFIAIFGSLQQLMENGVDAEAITNDHLSGGLVDVIGTTEELEMDVRSDKMHEVQELGNGRHEQFERDDDHVENSVHDAMMLEETRGGIGAEHQESGVMEGEEDHMGFDEDTRIDGIETSKGQVDKHYKEGPWDVLEMLVLVSAMKEYAETVGDHPLEDHISEQEKWHSIESYCLGQLVLRSALDCSEKWACLSVEFKRIKDFESNMVQDQISYWEMTYDERRNFHLPGDFSQEVYNALWHWDDRDRIGEIGAPVILEDEINIIKERSSFGSIVRTRKRSDRGEYQVSRKVSRGEGSIEPSFLGSQLLMLDNQQSSLALVETPQEILPSEDDVVWNAQFSQLRANQNFWAPHGRASATWAFYVVNDNSEPDSARPQQMRCAICHPAQQEHRPNSATRVRKGVVTYNKQHGTTSMKKHVAQEHGDIFTKYKATRMSNATTRAEFQHSRRMKNDPLPSIISDILYNQNSNKKFDPAQERLLEDLVLYVAKGCHPMSVVENVWLKKLVMNRQFGRVSFPSSRQLTDEVIPRVVSQIIEKNILPSLRGCVSATVTFDLWMSRRGVNSIATVVHFINESWETCHVTIGVLEASVIAGEELVMEVKDLLSSFNLMDKIIAFVVKDDDSRLTSLAEALSKKVVCSPLQLSEPYTGTCFGNVLSKACENTTTDEKACDGLRAVSIEAAISSLRRSISSTSRSAKRRLEWMKACADVGLRPRKLRAPVKGRFASKVILCQEALDYQPVLQLCSASQSDGMFFDVPSVETWAIAKAVTVALNPVLQQCVMNRSKGYWLLSDAIAAALSLYLQLHKETINRSLPDPKLDPHFESELEVLQVRLVQEVMSTLSLSLNFTLDYSAKHSHNMLALMLDPRYKGLSLLKDYVGRDMALAVVAEVDNRALLPCLVTVFKQLNPSSVENVSALSPTSKDFFDENSLFGSSASHDEAIVGHLKAELSLFRRLRIDSKECENPLAWWKDREVQFPNVGFLARQILGIVGSQVETERIFSIVGVITEIHRRHLGTDNLDKLVLIRENWKDDSRAGSEYPAAGHKMVDSVLENYLLGEENILDEHEDLLMEAVLFDD
uniref:BED-type domain-containing protein n=1 Tax=Physcomitrium patens TaxID=3218 RepID=A0A7I4C3X5_PHYPA|nr:uncharacterized protein LOC112274515 isoform X1 [Physcomitrium patens]|eukprot:XP_024359895.1 uncharacterized protein LOC112274515 isoform X1 [Physcomitrella patens]